MALPQVSYAEHQAESVGSLADDGRLGEEQRVLAFLGSSEFGKDDASHEGLDHDTSQSLHTHDEHSFGTLLSGSPDSVADGVLRLDGEQEAGGERLDVEHTGHPVVVTWKGRKKMSQVTVTLMDSETTYLDWLASGPPQGLHA